MSISLLGDSGDQAGGAISSAGIGAALTVDSLGNQIIITAVADGGGNLKIIVWEVASNGGIKRLGDSGQQGEGISLIDIAGGEGFLVTAIRDSSGNLLGSTRV
jgi:hypothetical protein